MKDQKEKALAVPCGERIRLLREQLDMNQEQLAEFLECSEVSISKIERGIHMMKNWRMIRLCQMCGVSMDYLIRGIDQTDAEDIPLQLIEMYKNADAFELRILEDHMRSAEREIDRKHELEKKLKIQPDFPDDTY